jgi:hypothetical protein
VAAAVVAPSPVGTIADQSYTQNSGVKTVATGASFAGTTPFTFSLDAAPAGVSIDAAGVVIIPTNGLLNALVTVRAANAAGAATQSFKVTVAAAVVAPSPVGTIADQSYTQNSGVKKVATAGNFTGTTPFTFSLAAAPGGVTIDAAGEVSIPTATLISGQTVTVRAANGAGSATQSFRVTVRGAAAGGFSDVPDAQLAEATSKALTKFTAGTDGTANAAFFGPAMAIEAYAAFAGQTAADSHIVAQLRYNLQGGNCPGGNGGYGLQHQVYFAAAAAIVRRIPRIWNDELTATERTKIDLLMKALLIAGAAQGSDNNPKSPNEKSFNGGPDYGTGGNVNFRNAKPVVVLCARSFLGSSDAVTSFLNGLSRSAFANALQAQDLTNAYQVANNTGTWTHAQVESAVENWKNKGSTIDQFQTIARRLHEECFSKTVENGYNNGAGIMHEGTKRAIVQANPNPDRPELGKIGMIQEYDSQDAEGVRSSAKYSALDHPLSTQLLLVMMCDGTLGRGSSEIQTLKNRIHNGMSDHKYKSDNGYWSYAHGGEGANNDVWKASTHAKTWGWSYQHGVWFDIIKPWLDAA